MCIPRPPSAIAIARPTRRPAPVTSPMRLARSIDGTLGQCASAATHFHASVLLFQPWQRHAHDTEYSRPLYRPMPVGATAGHEREEFRERGEPVRVLGRMPRVSNLQAIESQSDVPFDRLTSTVRTRVRDDGEATAGMNERDGVANGQLVLGNERGFASAQVAIEGVARVACPAAVDEHAGEVWATDRRVASTSQDILERDRNSQRVELLHDLDCTCVAPLAKRP